MCCRMSFETARQQSPEYHVGRLAASLPQTCALVVGQHDSAVFKSNAHRFHQLLLGELTKRHAAGKLPGTNLSFEASLFFS